MTSFIWIIISFDIRKNLSCEVGQILGCLEHGRRISLRDGGHGLWDTASCSMSQLKKYVHDQCPETVAFDLKLLIISCIFN